MDSSGFGSSFNGAMNWLVGLAFLGGAFALAFLGALVGAILSLPFALWQHDFSVMLLPVSIFAAIPPIAAGMYLLAEFALPRITR